MDYTEWIGKLVDIEFIVGKKLISVTLKDIVTNKNGSIQGIVVHYNMKPSDEEVEMFIPITSILSMYKKGTKHLYD